MLAPHHTLLTDSSFHDLASNREVGELTVGESFGTYSCLLGEPRAATVVALSFCELYSLKRSDLEEVALKWPELAEEFSTLGQCMSGSRGV